MKEVKDSHILETLQKNRNAGGELLFKRYYKPLVSFANSIISDQIYAEDLVQEVFYHFIRGEVYLKIAPEVLATYLFRSVKNASMDRLNQKKIPVTPLDSLRFNIMEEEYQTIDPELILAIHQAIHTLPMRTRLVVEAVFIRGKKYKEVAEELNITVNTVKTLLASGLKQLRALFSETLLLFFFLKFETKDKK